MSLAAVALRNKRSRRRDSLANAVITPQQGLIRRVSKSTFERQCRTRRSGSETEKERRGEVYAALMRRQQQQVQVQRVHVVLRSGPSPKLVLKRRHSIQ